MVRQEQNLGDLELEVLKIIWGQQPCSVKQVADVLAERRDYARTTTLTVIQRLHAKALVTRRKREGVWQYTAAQPRDQVLSRLVRKFVEGVLDASPAPFVAYLTQSAKLSREQIESLQSIIRSLEKSREREQP